MLKVGEKVRFVDEEGEGRVLKIEPNGQVVVLDEHGFQQTYAADELVPAERDRAPGENTAAPVPAPQRHFISRTETEDEESASEAEAEPPELALLFMSCEHDRPETSDKELFLLNNSPLHVMTNISVRDANGNYNSLFHGQVNRGERAHVSSVRKEDVMDMCKLLVDVIFYDTHGHEHRSPFSCRPRIKATRFVKRGNYVRFYGFEGPSLCVPLEIEQPAAAPVSVPAPRRPKKKDTVPSGSALRMREEEVDLHLDKLPDGSLAITDHEKLLLQLQHFERELSMAMKGNVAKITFIHGKGKGTLKREIRARLRRMKLEFSDDFRLNEGVTVVFLGIC